MTVPTPPVAQPIVYKDNTGSQLPVPGEYVIGQLDEYYFVTWSINTTAHIAWVSLWRITSKSNGALIVAQRQYNDCWKMSGGSNDKGDAVVVYRGVGGDWKMDVLTHEKSSLITRTVTLQGSSAITTPAVLVTMDGLEVVVVDSYTPVFQRAWGFTMDGQWSWDVMPPFHEYPYSGYWLSFPRQQRGLWVNDTVLSWYDLNYNSSGWMTYDAGTMGDPFTYTVTWGSYEDYLGPLFPDPTTPSADDRTILTPYPFVPPVGQEWRGSGGSGFVTTSTPYGQTRSTADFSGSIYIPDYANGETSVMGTWDTSLVPTAIRLHIYFVFGVSTRYIRTSSTVTPGTPAYEANKVTNGPNPGQVIVNGTDYGSIAVVRSIGSRQYLDEPEFQVDVTIDLTATPPAPGTFTIDATVESLYPTADALSAVGRSYSDFLGASTSAKYNYSGIGGTLANPPYFYYLQTPTTGGTKGVDTWDFGFIGWLRAGAYFTYDFDSSDRGGGFTELHDMTAVWGLGDYLDRISAETLALRGVANPWAVGQSHPYHQLEEYTP